MDVFINTLRTAAWIAFAAAALLGIYVFFILTFTEEERHTIGWLAVGLCVLCAAAYCINLILERCI